MSDSLVIYNLGKIKNCYNGLVELEEECRRYRFYVTADTQVTFQVSFDPQADFSFVLEIVSDGTHLISFNENLNPQMNELPVNRGTTKIFINKKLGIPYYEITVSRADAPEPTLLTDQNEVLSKFLVTAPKGGNWNPNRILRDYYDGYSDIQELYFEFFTLVSVDYVKYWSNSSSVAMSKFVLEGSIDEKNWTTLLYKENEICYGKVYTERKGCFRFYRLTIGYTGDENKPGGVMLFGTEIDNNDYEITNLTPYMSSDSTGFATLTASTVNSGSVANLTDGDLTTYIRITKGSDDNDTSRWLKYELATASIANLRT